MDTADPVLSKILSFINQFGWLFELSILGIAVVLIWLACGRYGKLRFGKEKPEFNNWGIYCFPTAGSFICELGKGLDGGADGFGGYYSLP